MPCAYLDSMGLLPPSPLSILRATWLRSMPSKDFSGARDPGGAYPCACRVPLKSIPHHPVVVSNMEPGFPDIGLRAGKPQTPICETRSCAARTRGSQMVLVTYAYSNKVKFRGCPPQPRSVGARQVGQWRGIWRWAAGDQPKAGEWVRFPVEQLDSLSR